MRYEDLRIGDVFSFQGEDKIWIYTAQGHFRPLGGNCKLEFENGNFRFQQVDLITSYAVSIVTGNFYGTLEPQEGLFYAKTDSFNRMSIACYSEGKFAKIVGTLFSDISSHQLVRVIDFSIRRI